MAHSKGNKRRFFCHFILQETTENIHHSSNQPKISSDRCNSRNLTFRWTKSEMDIKIKTGNRSDPKKAADFFSVSTAFRQILFYFFLCTFHSFVFRVWLPTAIPLIRAVWAPLAASCGGSFSDLASAGGYGLDCGHCLT